MRCFRLEILSKTLQLLIDPIDRQPDHIEVIAFKLSYCHCTYPLLTGICTGFVVGFVVVYIVGYFILSERIESHFCGF